ncbi:DNA gyrase inhibitor YacG [Bradyrhizobium sp. dw_78]|uniref:DNA gyrase inhibitor YacG n=1 Tax=Bradyrhizobium sp. dw_78 TaxID=2719793 RepID=UPI001BD5840F|nr:DNA gyrase inhibitor YacG [Bradyrhizobium sp. dw_78]
MPAKPRGAGRSGKGAAGRSAGPPTKASAKTCPICGKPASEATLPFCSPRCRDVDLNRWLSGSYAIPGRPEDDEEAE